MEAVEQRMKTIISAAIMIVGILLTALAPMAAAVIIVDGQPPYVKKLILTISGKDCVLNLPAGTEGSAIFTVNGNKLTKIVLTVRDDESYVKSVSMKITKGPNGQVVFSKSWTSNKPEPTFTETVSINLEWGTKYYVYVTARDAAGNSRTYKGWFQIELGKVDIQAEWYINNQKASATARIYIRPGQEVPVMVKVVKGAEYIKGARLVIYVAGKPQNVVVNEELKKTSANTWEGTFTLSKEGTYGAEVKLSRIDGKTETMYTELVLAATQSAAEAATQESTTTRTASSIQMFGMLMTAAGFILLVLTKKGII